MEEFEETVAQLKLQLVDAEHQRHQRIRVRPPLMLCVVCNYYRGEGGGGLFPFFLDACASFQDQELKFQQQKDQLQISLETKVSAAAPLLLLLLRRSREELLSWADGAQAEGSPGRAEIKRGGVAGSRLVSSAFAN